MASILTTGPAVEPITLAEAKAHLRIGHSDEDEMISRLISAARRHIELHTGLCLIAQEWSCLRDAWPPSPIVELPIGPVLSVNVVKVFGEDDQAAVIDPAHYYLDRNSRPARLALRQGRIWPRPGRLMNGIEITITAGFGLTAAAVPQPLRQVLFEIVAHWYGHRGDDAKALPLPIAAEIAGFREVHL